ncbi:MAG: toll/interleukin-1 receptor domain-containing protein [Leptolyngbyaceae cyanobacterium CSU_1_4]|nr:toll/interleukin-1 receptor domain-containing protein [Leptolyngbyaceae cyanobacterium CSU_1_4]
MRDKLEIHLSSLRQQGVISSWHDRQIVAGSEWEEEIDRHMRTADIILLLVSPDFVNSKYCYNIELPYAMQRHEAREAYVVPIWCVRSQGGRVCPLPSFKLIPVGEYL